MADLFTRDTLVVPKNLDNHHVNALHTKHGKSAYYRVVKVKNRKGEGRHIVQVITVSAPNGDLHEGLPGDLFRRY